MPEPRSRPADLPARAQALVRQLETRPDRLPTVRPRLLTLARRARKADDTEALAAIRRHMAHARRLHAAHVARLAAVSLHSKRDPSGTDPLTRWYARQLGDPTLLPSAAELRADALNAAAWPRTLRDLTAARRQLVQALWDARRLGDRATYLEVHRSYTQVCGRLAREGRRLSADDRLLRQRLRSTSPLQQLREAGQRVAADTSPARAVRRTAAQDRDRDRFRANVVAQALWAIHQGTRDWSALDTKPHTGQAAAPGGVRTSGDLPRPQRLELRVPESAHGPATTLHLYRVDYERLLDSWGYHQAARASRLADKLRATSDAADLAALYALALGNTGRPDVARAWHAYVEGPRLGDVFREHVSGSMQLAAKRPSDLGDAALAVYGLCQVAPVVAHVPVAYLLRAP